MGNVIRVKPHHFVDILCAVGAGQTTFKPHPYGHAVHSVSEQVLADRDVVLEMDLGADDICKPCKHNIEGLCDDTIDTSFRPGAPTSKREYNLLIDERWCERLGLKQGDRLTARDFSRRVKERMGDISDIYRENPAQRVADKAQKLREGITTFLA